MAKDISVRLDDSTYAKLEKAAAEEKRSVSGFVRILIEEHFAEENADGNGESKNGERTPKRERKN